MNRRVTYTTDGNDGLIGAIRFSTGANSLEVDNLVFAVPEPATWLMMLAGFGMVAMSMRARRRRTRIVFA
ncbi:PEPxxWA-CTERM sorting domain-containing protein [Sphingomonas sp. CFBP 8760]|nr:PEPxxWA-CTERM sorting domain-containing protein [Sphingomonas sp. CFBP 8760]